MSVSPVEPEAKILAVLCDLRVDYGFLTPERIAETTGLHVKLVEDALARLETAGLVSKDDDLLKKRPGEPARGFWYKPRLAGYRALYGEEAAQELCAKVLMSLEQSTRYLPDAEATELRHVYQNGYLVEDTLRDLEGKGLVSAKAALGFSKTPRWELTGHGARVLEEARQKTVSESSSLGL